MLTKPLSHQERTGHFPVLPHQLLKILIVGLALSVVTAAAATAEDTIIVIPTVNSDVQSHAAVTVGSRLSRSGFRVTSPEALLQSLNMGPVISRPNLLARGGDIVAAVGKAIIELIDLEITETGTGPPGYEIRLSSEIYEPSSQQLVASWAVPNTTLVPPTPCAAACQAMTLRTEIERMADTLGESLVFLLQEPGGTLAGDGSAIAVLQVELIDLSAEERVQLLDLMRNEFPGFVDITRSQTSGPRQRLRYHTTADLDRLGEWIMVSLAEIGLDVGEDVQFVMTGNRIDIRRISVVNRKGTTGNQVKFN
ncbi:MAG: hypothetical protein VXX06_10500 [Pseudomonadota bacterium]|nr:hypothetical protein [Pseudomonadota bacterium]